MASVALVLIAAVAPVGCGTGAATAPTGSHTAGAPPPPGRPQPPLAAAVTIAARAPTAVVPRSYLGVSTEYWALPLYAPRIALLERVLSLLRVPGAGPLVLRVGGDSADHAFWDPGLAPMPSWAFTLTPRWLDEARALVHRVGVRLILDLNLVTDTPARAARWAQAAVDGLPQGSIIAFEVGNEPDIYSRADWLATTAGRLPAGEVLPERLTATAYVKDFRADAEALQTVASSVALAGPALSEPQLHADWITRLLAADRGLVGLITVHRYPYSACAAPGSRAYPTIARLLSPQASVEMAAGLATAVSLAHDSGLALRVTELNSVTCGGLPDISDTFATALWAPDALFDLMRVGVDGVNIHVRADMINAPFALTGAGVVARPLLYGLILFARTLGPSAELVKLHVHAPARVDLSAWAVRTGPARSESLHVLLIDKGRRPLRVSLRMPTVGRPTVQRLLAPSAGAESGVTLAGQ
ncbi:MAG: hypothetical protein ACLPZR_28495, partial [Solirubrobacteraceae bacterium]